MRRIITGSARLGSLVETGAEPTHPEGSKDSARKNTAFPFLTPRKKRFHYAQMLRSQERSQFRSQFGSPCPSTRTPSEPAAVMTTRAPSVMISLSFPQRKPHRRQNASQNTPQNAPQLPSLQMHRSRQQNQVTSIDAAIHLLRRRTSTDAASFSTDVDTSSLPTDEDASSVASGEASPTPLSSGRRLPQPRVETSALPWWALGARLKSVPGSCHRAGAFICKHCSHVSFQCRGPSQCSGCGYVCNEGADSDLTVVVQRGLG